MSPNPAVRSLAVGVAAAVAVVGAYAWGHGTHVASAATPSAAQAPAAVLTAATSAAPTDGAAGGINVGGTGRVTGKPNLLRLQTSIEVTRPNVNDAMQGANVVMADVQKTLKSDGVADADLQTSGLSVQPNYDYTNNTSHLTGYTVSENLSVVLRNLTTAGSIISDAARVGGDSLRIGDATLDLDADGDLISQARLAAFADAKAKAEAYATAAGRTLGAVTSITESTDSQPQTFDYSNYAAAAPSAAAAPVPIQAGTQDVTVDVAVTWALN